jgi:hypothetical protein
MVLFSCTNTDKKEEIPVKETQEKEVVVPAVEPEKDRVVFMVQVAALKKDNTTLNSIKNVQVFKENALFKYRLGTFETYKEARVFRTQLIRDYKGAFVQALVNDAPISIVEGLQY